MDNFGFNGIRINGKPLDTFSGVALLDYSVGETSLKNETFQGVNRSTWALLKTIFGFRQLVITFVFTGRDRREAALNRSALNAELFGKSEIFIADDGFYYSVYCDNMGAEVLIGEGKTETKIKAKYTFKGIRHDALRTITVAGGASFFCPSTMPFTDCRLTATVGTSAASYQLGGAVFADVTAGDVLVFDGIDKKITKNGANAAASASWTDFPQLVPGANSVTCPNSVTVEFAPTYL